MARKTTRSRKTTRRPNVEDFSVTDMASVSGMPPTPPKQFRFLKIVIGVIILAVIGGILAKKYAGTFVAGTVNGMPILRSDLNQRLASRFGSQMLDAMVGEKLITSEATKKQVIVSDAEVKARITEIAKTLSGAASLDDTLKLQGISRPEFENQVRIQLMIDKMFVKEGTVSTQEVDDFIKTSGSMLTASTDAEKRTQAEQQLHTQKVSQKFAEWYNKLKQDAKIQKYL